MHSQHTDSQCQGIPSRVSSSVVAPAPPLSWVTAGVAVERSEIMQPALYTLPLSAQWCNLALWQSRTDAHIIVSNLLYNVQGIQLVVCRISIAHAQKRDVTTII